MSDDLQLGECAGCGTQVVWKARLEGTDVKVVAQHVAPNLDCDKPYPKGEMVGTTTDEDVRYPPQVIACGVLIAIPPGWGADQESKHAMVVELYRSVLKAVNFGEAGHYVINEAQPYQLPERVFELNGCPADTKYFSINGPVVEKNGLTPQMHGGLIVPR